MMLVVDKDLQFDDKTDAMDVELNITAACSVRQSQWSSNASSSVYATMTRPGKNYFTNAVK